MQLYGFLLSPMRSLPQNSLQDCCTATTLETICQTTYFVPFFFFTRSLTFRLGMMFSAFVAVSMTFTLFLFTWAILIYHHLELLFLLPNLSVHKFRKKSVISIIISMIKSIIVIPLDSRKNRKLILTSSMFALISSSKFCFLKNMSFCQFKNVFFF